MSRVRAVAQVATPFVWFGMVAAISLLRRYWPVRSTMAAGGADVDWLYEHNSAGVRSHFDANVTVEEIEHLAQLLRGPQTIS
ncbi:hypothetical protein ACFQO7_05820 [Catellatospora aurea]|uniref:Uncharacterized protein n=1 Tax=Catellatospora aurea TaxID=1337874 RepID=A0ABW2GPP8_9ACTN